jgi:hypothetical protein
MPSEKPEKTPALVDARSGGFRWRENVWMSLIQIGRGERFSLDFQVLFLSLGEVWRTLSL